MTRSLPVAVARSQLTALLLMLTPVLALAPVLALVALAASPVFTTGQSAQLVLGQANFTSSGNALTQNGMRGPEGIAVDPTTGKVFVADSNNNRVLRFASLANLSNGANAEIVLGQATFTANVAATTQNGMNTPVFVAVDSAGRLWVSEIFNNRVLRFDAAASKTSGANADGVLGQTTFTSSASATTQSGLSFPQGVVADGSGRLWVADYANHRVLRFDNAAAKANGANADAVLGQANFTAAVSATTSSGLRFPFGVALEAGTGRLWVADSGNHRLVRFDAAATKANGANADGVLGQATFTTGASGSGAAGLNNPIGVAVDSGGRLFVGDFNNNRVLWFDTAAAKANGANADGVLGQTSFAGTGTATQANRLTGPNAVAVDAADGLWVADFNNNRTLYFAGAVASTPTPTPVIPEPPVWLLFASGLLLLGWRLARRR